MTKLSYSMFIWKNHRWLGLFTVIVIMAVQFLIIKLIGNLDIKPVVENILAQLPQQIKLLVNEMFISQLSVKGAVAFGFSHPIVLALLVINAIIIPTRHITGEIETGTLELLLTYPVNRSKLLFLLWLAASLFIFAIVVGALLGSFFALVFSNRLTLDLLIQMLQIGANLWLFIMVIMSYTLLISTFGKKGAKTEVFSAGLTLVFYVLHFLSVIWDSIGFFTPCNIFSYYQPQKLMFAQQSFWHNVSVLSTIITICLLISIKQFNRRDIPG